MRVLVLVLLGLVVGCVCARACCFTEEDLEGVLERITIFHNDFMAGNLSYDIGV